MSKLQLLGKATSVAIALVAFTLSSTIAASGASNDSAPPVPEVDLTNVDAISKLDAQGQCLFRLGVYPENTEDPADRIANGIFRAELIRAYPDQIAGVQFETNDAGAIVAATVHAKEDTVLAREGLDQAATRLPQIYRDAVAELIREGVALKVIPDAVYSIVEGCAIEDLVDGGAAFGLPRHVGFAYGINESTGRVELSVGKDWVDRIKVWSDKFGNAITVIGLAGDIGSQARGNAYFPAYGGSRIANISTGQGCSDSFRVGSTALLIANHCPYGQWKNYLGAGIVQGTISSAYSLAPAGVDINLLAGGPFSNAVWLGNSTGTGVAPVTGFITEANVTAPAYFTFSGAFSGQGTLIIIQEYQTLCYQIACTSHAYHAITQNPICKAGDSGGPWMDLVPGGFSYRAVGVHVAGTAGPVVPGQTRDCYAVGFDAITYLYGGITVG
jgi:hypothetical protein